jgi:glycosyltransferase involved in cell wall biosynthesis
MLRFDIILPTIGRDSLLPTIESVLNQEHQNWLLWIREDGICIPDHLVDHIKDDRICWSGFSIKHEHHYGAFTRNAAIAKGNAEWIAYIDDDDEWLPNHLSTHARIIKENSGVDMVRTAGRMFKMGHKHPRSSKRVKKYGPINTDDILTVGMSHTRALFEKTSQWQPCDNHDHLLWQEMLAAGGQAEESTITTFNFRR